MKIKLKKDTNCLKFDKYDEKIFGKKIYPTTPHVLLGGLDYDLTNLKITKDIVEFELWDDGGYIFSYLLDKDNWVNNVIEI